MTITTTNKKIRRKENAQEIIKIYKSSAFYTSETLYSTSSYPETALSTDNPSIKNPTPLYLVSMRWKRGCFSRKEGDQSNSAQRLGGSYAETG